MEKNIPRIGVGVFVFKNGKFLMGKRRGAHGTGSWSVPGGHLEFGEAIEETAARELLEETGVVGKNLKVRAFTNDIFVDECKHYVTLWVTCDWDSGEPQIIEPDKFTDLDWCDFNSLPTPLFHPWVQLFKSDNLEVIKQDLEKSK